MPTPDPVDPVGPDPARDRTLDGFDVLAGGGLVWRPGPHGVEILVVHRERYDDWTLPKGKADPGESLEVCARREVVEETGLRCVSGEHLADVTYVDHKGRTKLVRYWEMTVVDGQFEANDEVDEVRWLSIDDTRDRLTYEHDRPVLGRFASLLDGRASDPTR